MSNSVDCTIRFECSTARAEPDSLDVVFLCNTYRYIDELETSGYELSRTLDFLPKHFFLVFQLRDDGIAEEHEE